MTGKTHVSIGIATALTISANQTNESKLIIVLFSIIGSLLPDLDHPQAKLNQKLLIFKNNLSRITLYLCLSLLFLYLYLENNNFSNNKIILVVGIFFLLLALSTHRGFTHSLLGLVTSSIIIKYLSLKYGLIDIYIGFFIGYLMHLVADFFNPKGIKIFYPLKKNISAFLTIKTGGKMEKKLFSIFVIYSLIILSFILIDLNM